MTNEMKAFLPLLISDFLTKNKSSLTITRTANPNCECLVISNIKSRKVCLLGSLKDPLTGENKIAASMINLQKYVWAHNEGFTIDEMLNELQDVVLKTVSPGDLPELLA